MLVGLLQRVWPWHMPAEYGAIYTCACATRIEPTAPTAGVPSRSVGETMTDTVRWLHQAGLVSTRAAGQAVGAAGAMTR
jgi:hypothetical protein